MALNTAGRDWGPVPDLAAHLMSLTTPAAPAYDPLCALGRDGLWGEAVRVRLRPGERRRRVREQVRPTGRVARGWHRLAGSPARRTVEFWRERAAFRRPPEVPFWETLAECHLWLGRRNLDRVTPLFKPFWNDIPTELSVVSEKALVFAVVAWVIDQYGARALPRMTSGSLKLLTERFAPGPDDLPGDLLSRHIDLECVLDRAAAVLQIPNQFVSEITSSPPRPGGLRREDSLQTLLALRLRELPPEKTQQQAAQTRGPWVRVRRGRKVTRLSAWGNTIDRLVQLSPLTRLVYSDLVTPECSLADVQKLAPNTQGRAFQPLLCRPDATAPESVEGQRHADRPGWRLHWMSVLARTMVGATLSPSACWYQLQLARTRLRQLQVQLEQLNERSALVELTRDEAKLLARLPQQIASAVTTVATRESAEFNHKLARLAQQCAVLAASGTDDSTVSTDAVRADRQCLQLRWLDMLVRHLTSQLMPEVEEQFRDNSETWSVARRRDVAMVDDDSVLLDGFLRSLTGCSLDDLESRLTGTVPGQKRKASPRSSEGLRRWFAVRWSDAFVPAIDVSDEDEVRMTVERLSAGAGITAEAVTHLVRRFSNDDHGGVLVSFQGERGESFAPANLLDAWSDAITRRLLLQNEESGTAVTVRTA